MNNENLNVKVNFSSRKEYLKPPEAAISSPRASISIKWLRRFRQKSPSCFVNVRFHYTVKENQQILDRCLQTSCKQYTVSGRKCLWTFEKCTPDLRWASVRYDRKHYESVSIYSPIYVLCI